MEGKIMRLLFLLHLIVNIKGESCVIGSSEPVKGKVGEDVVLPCHLKPPLNMWNRTVEWKHLQKNVHLYRSRGDDPSNQDESFKGRTSLFHEEMANGNISLKLTNVTEQDSGNYTCYVSKLKCDSLRNIVTLIVEPKDVGDKGHQTNNAACVPGSVIAVIIAVIAHYVCMYVSSSIEEDEETPRERNRGLDTLPPYFFLASQTHPRDVECHLAGGEGSRACATAVQSIQSSLESLGDVLEVTLSFCWGTSTLTWGTMKKPRSFPVP